MEDHGLSKMGNFFLRWSKEVKKGPSFKKMGVLTLKYWLLGFFDPFWTQPKHSFAQFWKSLILNMCWYRDFKIDVDLRVTRICKINYLIFGRLGQFCYFVRKKRKKSLNFKKVQLLPDFQKLWTKMFGRPRAFKNGQKKFLRWSKEVKKGPK